MAVLTGTEGPAKGKTFELQPGTRLLIGRDTSSNLYLEDNEISRHHAEIFERDGIFYIKDFKSTNGTFVNGVQITTKTLKDSDRIKIGQSLLRFAFEETILAKKPEQHFSSGKEFGAHTIEIKLDEQREETQKDKPPTIGREVTYQDINTLYRAFKIVISEEDPTTQFKKILKLVVESVKADYAYFLVWQEENDKITVPLVYPEGKKQPAFSRTIVKRVTQYNRALLTSDATTDPNLRGSDSIVKLGIKSVICTPITVIPHGQIVLYLESNKTGESFTQTDLELATTVALQIGMGFVRLSSPKSLEWLSQQEDKSG